MCFKVSIPAGAYPGVLTVIADLTPALGRPLYSLVISLVISLTPERHYRLSLLRRAGVIGRAGAGVEAA